MPGGAASCLGARQTLSSCHRFEYCRLPIADCRFLRFQWLIKIGNRQSAIGNKN
jgi:hypothetical protein